jgi:peroxiredoxin
VLRAGQDAPEVELIPAFGRAVSLPSDLRGSPLALVCLGGLSTPDTRAAIDALQSLTAPLDRAGVRLLAITSSTRARTQDFVSRYHVLFPVVPDSERVLRSGFGLTDARPTDAIRGVARELTRARRSIRAGRGWVEPGAYATAACFVLGIDGRVDWSADGVCFEAMLQAAELSGRP